MTDLTVGSCNGIIHCVHSCDTNSQKITYTISQIYESHVQFYRYLLSVEVSLRRAQPIMLFYEAQTYIIFLTYIEKFSSKVAQQKKL
jgi:hypothetical protein